MPKALFNSKALFNPYQYLPFRKIMKWEKERYVPNGSNILITDEVGVGKTFETGIILRELLCANPNLSVLIVCPPKLCENWKSELTEYFEIGAVNYHAEQVMGQISILPYSYFAYGKIEKIYPFDVLILDEAHYIRNKGVLYKCIRQLVEKQEKNRWSVRIFLTGTPIFNTVDDYDHIIELLSYGGQKYETTKTLQGEANCYDEILSIKLGGISEDKKEAGKVLYVNDLEKSVYQEIISYEEREGRLAAKYGKITGFLKRISSSSFYSLKQFVEKSSAFQKSDLETNDYIGIDDDSETDDRSWMDDAGHDYTELKELLEGWNSKEDTKLNALKALLKFMEKKESQGTVFKVVIFSCFITTCSYLKEQLDATGYQTYIIIGGTTDKKVSEYKAAFEKNKKPSVMICSDAVKEGHNLQFCHYLIHYDFPYTPAAIGQRNGRIYRKGQAGKPEVYYMYMEGGYDERLFGEIIVEKCQLIKVLEKVSTLNILPEDADQYIQNCVSAFIDDYFDRKKFQKNKSDKPGQENGGSVTAASTENEQEKEIFGQFLKKYFAEKIMDECGKVQLKWKFKKAEELYDEIQSKSEGHRTKLKEFYQNILKDADSGQSIREIYMDGYRQILGELVQEWFGCEKPDREAAEAKFVSCCAEYVDSVREKKSGAALKTLYCHDLIQNEQLSIDEYKRQFQPLKEW